MVQETSPALGLRRIGIYRTQTSPPAGSGGRMFVFPQNLLHTTFTVFLLINRYDHGII